MKPNDPLLHYSIKVRLRGSLVRSRFVCSLWMLISIAVGTQSAEAADFAIQIPSGWTEANGLFGMANLIVGPECKDSERGPFFRPVFSVTKIPENAFDFKRATKPEAYAEFESSRRAWIASRDGVFVGATPLKEMRKPDGSRAITLGLSYSLGDGESLTEQSTYVQCKGSLFLLKQLRLRESSKAVLRDLASIEDSFRCPFDKAGRP